MTKVDTFKYKIGIDEAGRGPWLGSVVIDLKEVKGLEKEPEKGKRCTKCYDLRLKKTAELAEK